MVDGAPHSVSSVQRPLAVELPQIQMMSALTSISPLLLPTLVVQLAVLASIPWSFLQIFLVLSIFKIGLRVRSAAAMRSGVVLVLDGGPELARGREDDFVFFLTTAWPLVSSAFIEGVRFHWWSSWS